MPAASIAATVSRIPAKSFVMSGVKITTVMQLRLMTVPKMTEPVSPWAAAMSSGMMKLDCP